MDKSLDTGNSSEIDNQLMQEQQPFKFETLTLVLLITSLILTGAVTFMTFIWGLL